MVGMTKAELVIFEIIVWRIAFTTEKPIHPFKAEAEKPRGSGKENSAEREVYIVVGVSAM